MESLIQKRIFIVGKCFSDYVIVLHTKKKTFFWENKMASHLNENTFLEPLFLISLFK